jgi:hypothetical protein
MLNPILRSILSSIKKPIIPGDALWTAANRTVDLWLDSTDASTFTFDGSLINVQADKSGNGNDVRQTTASNKPTIATVSGINSVSLDGVNDRLEADSYQPFGELTVYIVASNESSTTAGVNPLIATAASGGDINPGFVVFNGSQFVSPTRSYQVEGQATPAAIEYTNGTLGNPAIAQSTVALYSATFDCQDAAGRRLRIGSYDNGIYWGEANIYAVIIALGHDDTTARQKMEGYLAWKFEALGLVAALDASNPYKSAAPTV